MGSRSFAARSLLLTVAIIGCGGSDRSPPRAPTPASLDEVVSLEGRGAASRSKLIAIATAGDRDVALRAAAARALGRLADPTSVAALIDLLAERDRAVRVAAARALAIAAALGADGEALVAAAKRGLVSAREPEIAAALADVLGRAGDAAVAPLLVTAARDDDASVAAAAARALGLFGRRKIALGDAARAALVELSSRPPAALGYAAVWALSTEHDAPPDAAALAALEARTTDRDPEVRALALAGLARRHRGRERLARALRDADWRVAVAAVRGLETLGSEAAMRDLAAWLGSAEAAKASPATLRVALRAAAKKSDIEPLRLAAGLLAKRALPGASDLDVAQVHCLAAAVRARHDGELAPLESCGEAAPRWWRLGLVAEVAAASFATREPPETMARLEALAADNDPRVRAPAVTAAIELAATRATRPRALAVVGRALADPSDAVAGTAADGLAGLGLEGADKTRLEKALLARAAAALDGDSELGLTLLEAIGAGRVAAGEPLCRRALGHENRAFRAAARGCIVALGKPEPDRGEPVAAAVPPHPPRASGPLAWTVATSRGTLVIELDPAAAPWHVAAIAALTRQHFYDGLTFHRVVPGFVIQGGDPTGTGWGDPGFALPPEPTSVVRSRPALAASSRAGPTTGRFDRGAVGIADAGPGTGGCQWFVMHARAPHLEGRYTRIGRVVAGLDVLDRIAVGDRILSASIDPIEGGELSAAPARSAPR